MTPTIYSANPGNYKKFVNQFPSNANAQVVQNAQVRYDKGQILSGSKHQNLAQQRELMKANLNSTPSVIAQSAAKSTPAFKNG